MAGQVVTFYSYKGGVGRTFALANIGVILAQWGYRILLIDWDIEAPGLNHYFSEYSPPPTTGVLNFLLDCKKDEPKSWDSYTSHLQVPDCRHGIDIMAAAAENDDYTGLVQSLDWDELYHKHDFGARVEKLRSEWVEKFDFVLIDSRTGVTDFSGLTTAQLPDILAFLFTANVQSLEGCCRIAERAMEARRNLPLDRPALIPLPIVAKFDQREEYDRAQMWRSKFVSRLIGFYDVWTPSDIDKTRLIDVLTIPYVPRWTFGEDIAASIEPHETDGVRTPSTPISYTLETIAAVLANGFKKIELLSSSRDEYVLTARASAKTRKAPGGIHKVFISHARAYRFLAREVVSTVITSGFEGWIDSSLANGEEWGSRFSQMIEQADAMIVIVGPPGLTPIQNTEVEVWLRQTLRTSVRKPLIPLIIPGAEKEFLNSRLADFAGLSIDPDKPLEPQFERLLQRLRANETSVSSASLGQEELPKVYLYYSSEDEEFAISVAVGLQASNVEVVVPAFEGGSADLIALHEENLRRSDAVVIVWSSASEVWTRIALRQLKDWRALGRKQKFSFVGLIVGPPPSSRKMVLTTLRNEANFTLNLAEENEVTPELLAPLTSKLSLTPNSIP
jgi:hypothetical protein